MNKISDTNEVKVELKVPGFNTPNNIRLIKGHLTLNEIEKKGTFGEYVLDRGMSIRNLNKTLKEIVGNNSMLSFNLIKKDDKLIKDLEESEINFINIDGLSCYQSCTLQGFVHIIFPLSIKNLNKERLKCKKEKVKELDELKNDNIFNNAIIDILKEITYIQGCGNGGKGKDGNKGYKAEKIFQIAPPKIIGGQPPGDTVNVNGNHEEAIDKSKNFEQAKANEAVQNIFDGWNNSSPPKKSGIEYKILNGEDLVKVIEIKKKTIVSEAVKLKIEGNNKYYGNLVLKFNEDNLNDSDLDIYKLINDCPQIRKNFY